MPIQHLNLTAYFARKTSDKQGEYGVFKESKEKLGKVRKVITNTHKTPLPYSLFGEENRDN